MENQFTQCPHCRSVFRFQRGPSSGDDDEVRCNVCKNPFKVMQNLVVQNSSGWFDRPGQKKKTAKSHSDESKQQSEHAEDSPRTEFDGQGAEKPLSQDENLEEEIGTKKIRANPYDPKKIYINERNDSKVQSSSSGTNEGEPGDKESGTERHHEHIGPGSKRESLGEYHPKPEHRESPINHTSESEAGDDAHRISPEPDLQDRSDIQLSDRTESDGESSGQSSSKRDSTDQGHAVPGGSGIFRNDVNDYIKERPNPLVAITWSLVIVAFTVLLGLQVRLFFVERYAQDERYRPFLSLFCQVASCTLPAKQNPYLFYHSYTGVTLHPENPEAVRVTVKFVNQGDFAQPYPVLRLTLNDDIGRVVGRRTFHPEVYLDDASARFLAPGVQASVNFDLAHPYEGVVGYVVDIVQRPAS